MSLQFIDITTIAESPTNPRRTFDAEKLAELADSVGKHGVLQPVNVRRRRRAHSDASQPPYAYELIFGARRLRAARMAGLAEIPAIVRDATDLEVLELQILENAKRDDISALEEADAFSRLVTDHSQAPADVADRIGRPVEFVRRRLLLARLVPELRTMLDEQRIGIGSAELLAGLPEHSQVELATGELADEERTYTLREVQYAISRISRQLSDAGWDLGEALGDRGPCTGCGERTDAQAALFDDGREARCLNGECWAAKSNVWLARRRQQIADAGEELLEGDAAAPVLSYSYKWNPRRPLRQVNEPCEELFNLQIDALETELGGPDELEAHVAEHGEIPQPTWGQLAGDAPRVWVLDDRGRLTPWVRVADVVAELDNGFGEKPAATEPFVEHIREWTAPQPKTPDAQEREERARAEKEAAEESLVVRRQEVVRVVELVEQHGLGIAARMLLEVARAEQFARPWMDSDDRSEQITERRTGEAEEDLADLLEQLDERGVEGLLVEWHLTPWLQTTRAATSSHDRFIECLRRVNAPLVETPAPDPVFEVTTSGAGNIYADDRFSSPEAADLYQDLTGRRLVDTGNLIADHLGTHSVKTLREVIAAWQSRSGAGMRKGELVDELVAAYRVPAKHSGAA